MGKQSDFKERLLKECESLHLLISKLRSADIVALTYCPSAGKWNALEVINHLLLSNEFFLEQIILVLNKKRKFEGLRTYSPGWLGKYLAKTIRPLEENGIKFKGKTFRNLEPHTHSEWNEEQIQNLMDDYEVQLKLIEKYLNEASISTLKKEKVNSTFSTWIKLELGNAFDYMIGHNLRHFVQIKNNFSETEKETIDNRRWSIVDH